MIFQNIRFIINLSKFISSVDVNSYFTVLLAHAMIYLTFRSSESKSKLKKKKKKNKHKHKHKSERKERGDSPKHGRTTPATTSIVAESMLELSEPSSADELDL